MKYIRPALTLFILMTLITGLVYPLIVTAVAQAAFPHAANGSLITDHGKILGSTLIGQPTDSPEYFWSRPSGTSPYPDNATASGGSNLGPTNKALLDAIKGRVDALKKADPGQTGPVPTDLVTASASGVDPHISPEAAQYQAARIARVRHLAPDQVSLLIKKHTADSLLGVFGEAVVNVLELNLDLDRLKPADTSAQPVHN